MGAMRERRASRGHRARRAGAISIALASLLASADALADPTPTDADPSAEPLVDYDAPDPKRNGLNVARAFANLFFENYLLFQIDWFRGTDWNPVTRGSISAIAGSDFKFDYDPFGEDMFGHPLHGTIHFASARAAGLSFWESAAFPFLGALTWEVLGERQVEYPGDWRSKPSTNDFLMSATTGPLLGEGLYRLSSAMLDDRTTGADRFMRELFAAFFSPMRGLNRLYTGDAWKSGPGPLRPHPLFLSLDLGVDQVHVHDTAYTNTDGPTALVATEIHYGDLLPTGDKSTIGPLEMFDGYVALRLFGNDHLNGSQAYCHGVLYGWSTDLSSAGTPRRQRDNNVFGIVQSFDFNGASDIRFGGLSIGPADYMEWRFAHGRSLRVGLNLDWTYLAASDSPFSDPGKGHKFVMGGAVEESARLDLGEHGRITARSRHFVTTAIDGQGGDELLWFSRLSYDVDVLPHVALGVAPTIVRRRSVLRERSAVDESFDVQAFLRFHN